VKEKDNLSATARTFLHLLGTTSRELVEFVEVVSPSQEQPWIEEVGSIILKIPSPTGSKPEYLYLETRKRSIVIVAGTLLDYHVDWSKSDEAKESIQKAMQFFLDILEERRVILEKKVGIAFLKWSVVRCIDREMIARQTGNFTIYSWKGTYNRSNTM
jgi:hypothetical protein